MQHWPWRTLASNAAGHSWDRLQRASLCRADADLDELSADGDGAAAAGAREIHDRDCGTEGRREDERRARWPVAGSRWRTSTRTRNVVSACRPARACPLPQPSPSCAGPDPGLRCKISARRPSLLAHFCTSAHLLFCPVSTPTPRSPPPPNLTKPPDARYYFAYPPRLPRPFLLLSRCFVSLPYLPPPNTAPIATALPA